MFRAYLSRFETSGAERPIRIGAIVKFDSTVTTRSADETADTIPSRLRDVRMDRVNRRFLAASTLLAIPVALLMVTLSTGTTPEVRTAIAHDVDDSGAVQQVVGKQPLPRKSRPGLLQVLTGSQPAGDRQHHHQNMPSEGPKGLLDGLFEDSSRSTNRNSSQTSSSRHHSSNNATRQSENVDWNGIPYHRVNNAAVSRSSNTPISDPSQTAASSGGTRVFRGGTNRTLQATPASVRRLSEPTLARQPAQPLAVPTPARKVNPAQTTLRSFSTNSSSRRSTRRSVDALDASEIAAASKTLPAPVQEQDTVAELVPRVVRRRADIDPETENRPKSAQPEPKIAAKPKAKDVAAANEATDSKQATKAKDLADAKSADLPQPSTAVAAIGTPTPSEEPKSSGDVANTAPTTSLAPPTASQPEQQPTYTTPMNPATNPVPLAGIPTHPYAASIPANAASHRAGPPQGAFKPGQLSSGQNKRTQKLPAFAPQGQPQFNTASTPVGSGIVPNSGVASYRHPASQPVHDASQQPTYRNVDPYENRAYTPAPRMTTYGQPAANRSPVANNVPLPTHETATVPMHSINGYDSTARATTTDNFARSTYDSRNQMRDSAGSEKPGSTSVASELPGIRVVTHGPDSIMIRQTSEYEIRVENRGSIDAAGVMVRALVPDWAEIRGKNASRGDIDNQTQGSTERLVWTIDHLPAGSTERMFVRLTAARSGTYDLDVDWTTVPQKSVAKVQVHEPRLDLTIEGPEEVIYGQSQTYKVRVLNPGDGIAPNVVFTLSPNSATPQTQRIGDIPPGKEAQFDVELTAQDLGDLKIQGLATGDLELRAESAKTIRVAAAQLEAVLSGPELKYQNTEAMYGLEIQNSGAATSERIIATLRLPAGVQYLGGIDEAMLQGNALKWEINALAPGATRKYQLRCNMATTGEHLFAFDCKGTAAGNAVVSIATRVESISDLVLTINDPTAPAPIGSDVTYEIIIRNRGSKEANDVRAIAQFSHGIEPQRIEGQSGEVVTGQVLFDAIPRIGAGQEVRLRVIAQATKAGHHRFRTEIRSGDTVLVAEEATHYMSPKSERVSRRSTDASTR